MGESPKRILSGPEATESLGASLAAALLEHGIRRCLILLQGDLGAGKTTLVRGFLRRLGHAGPVPSPTYTLVEPYELAGLHISHLDLYRIGDADELEFLGWRDLEDSVALVEWPERAPALARRADLTIELEHRGDARLALLEARSRAGRRLAAATEADE